MALKSIEHLVKFNARSTATVSPRSSWSLQQSPSSSPGAALPCWLWSTGCWFWRCLLSRTSAFDSPLPWCFWLRHTWLSQRGLSRRKRGDGCLISSSLPSPSRGVCGLDRALEGREMASSFTGPLVPGWGWPELPRTRKPQEPCTGTWCCLGSALVLHIRGFISGFDVSGNGSGWSLCVCADLEVWHHYFNLHFLLLGLFCVLLRGCSEEDKCKQRRNSNKNSCYMIEFRLQLW